MGVPCTNCVAFSIECKIPTPKRKKTATGKAKDSDRYACIYTDHFGAALTQIVIAVNQWRNDPLEMTPLQQVEAIVFTIQPLMALLLHHSPKPSTNNVRMTMELMHNS